MNPDRSPKAYERKFQNISAILYENKLPYCIGLKPCKNYQKLLKTTVLDHVEKHSLSKSKPHEILYLLLKQIKQVGAIRVSRKGSGRYGLAIEEALGIPQNCYKTADFMGIELKTKSVVGLQTLFSRTPSSYGEFVSKLEMFEANCYFDQKKHRKALYTSFNCRGDGMGFRLHVIGNDVQVIRNKSLIMTFSKQRIEDALLSKHNQTAYIGLKRITQNNEEYCEIVDVKFCKEPTVNNFIKQIKQGNIHLDLTLSMDSRGALRDHGFLWRIQSSAIEQLYAKSEEMCLTDSLAAMQ